MQKRLQEFIAHAMPDRREPLVSEPVEISSGWESEIHAFALQHGEAEPRKREDLILRIYPGDDAYEKSAREFGGMRRLYEEGYPVPYVHALEREDSPFGKPFMIMDRVDGEMMWRQLDTAGPADRHKLLGQFSELFVRLHTMDWRPFVDEAEPFDAEDAFVFVDRWLTTAGSAVKSFPEVDFRPVCDWLEERRDHLPCSRPSPVHQDFHPGNVIVLEDGSAVVIDWTAFSVTDPRFDLAWTLILTYAYAGSWMRDAILQEYERLSGAEVQQIETFELIACTRRLYDVATSLAQGAESRGMRPEAVEMMRQQMGATARVYELLAERTGIRLAGIERMIESTA